MEKIYKRQKNGEDAGVCAMIFILRGRKISSPTMFDVVYASVGTGVLDGPFTRKSYFTPKTTHPSRLRLWARRATNTNKGRLRNFALCGER